MSQKTFDIAEKVIYNKEEIKNLLYKEVMSVIDMQPWFSDNNLNDYFLIALSDFIIFKLKWFIIEQTGESFETVDVMLDKKFVNDVFGEEFLTINYWSKK